VAPPDSEEVALMKVIRFTVRAVSTGMSDRALLFPGEDPLATLADAIVQSISTDVMVRLGDRDIHLAALLDPDHWDDDWREVGVDDADEFVAGLVEDG
jgi:hypothetical protein